MRSSIAIALLTAACASGPTDKYPFPTGDEPIGKGDQITNLPVIMGQPIEGSFTQQIDHPTDGSTSTLGTFRQRFWYSTQFAKSDDSPVIFYFCGEAPCDPYYVQSMADAAMSLNASVVALEHRYYGTSLPYPDETLAHMKYLTIHNALEDAAAFQQWATQILPLKGKWIAVGGSYPGMLAAFYREKHPELVVGAWASSAPVNVQESFSGYDAIASKALGETCTAQFQQVLSRASAAYDNPAQLSAFSTQVFGFPLTADEFSKTDFLGFFSDYAEGAAQYGYQRLLCAALAQETDPVQGFAEYLQPPLGGTPSASPPSGPTVPNLPAGKVPERGQIISKLAHPPAIDNFAGAEWFYQVCTEVGFFQVYNPDRSQSVMSDLMSDQYWANQCMQYVGQLPATDATRSEYYAPLAAGQVSNVLFTTGSLDPWSVLSFENEDPPAGLTTLTVATGSHCEDLQNLMPGLVLGVFKAHKQFWDLATQWTK
jgi:pimeloyl-ACP methyl ester carboxylesterase